MTLQQLKYTIIVAETGTFGEAARKLYVSQPGLSFAVRELEKELGITIFTRSNRGTTVTKVGEEFLRKAKQIVIESELLEEEFSDKSSNKHRLSVSTQHYTFVSLAFAELVNLYGDIEYELSLNETKTMDVLEDVRMLRSELGIIYLSKDNESVIGKILADHRLSFTELFTTYPYVLVGEHHPLAKSERVDIRELTDYPCVSFVQKDLDPYFFSEEVLGIPEQKRRVKISDRGALRDLLGKTNAYVVSTGLYLTETEGMRKFVAIPLDAPDSNELIHVGLINHKDIVYSAIGEKFCDIIKYIVQKYALDAHIKRYY
jgi:DNA-binding transcriptional LysR family regulator